MTKNTGVDKGAKRRIMRALKINEISGVDVPAQEGAVAVIMKRNSQDSIEKGSALTTMDNEHTHLVPLLGPPDGVELSSGETSFNDGHTHPWVRTATDSIVIGQAKGMDGVSHTHQVAVLSKTDYETGETENEDEADKLKSEKNGPADLLEQEAGSKKAAGDTGTVGDQGELNMTDKTQKADGAPTVEELQAQLARANSIGELSDAQKAHFNSLEGDAQDEFLGKSADERQSIVDDIAKQAQDADPVVYKTKDGIELRKSAGDAFIAMAKSNDALREQNEKLIEKSAEAALEKRAEDELAHLPGTVQERAAMLKAVDAIEDETQRAAALAALKAGNDAMSKSFETFGHRNAVTVGDSEQTLEGLAKAYQEKHDVSYEKAYSEVLETKEGRELYAKSVN